MSAYVVVASNTHHRQSGFSPAEVLLTAWTCRGTTAHAPHKELPTWRLMGLSL